MLLRPTAERRDSQCELDDTDVAKVTPPERFGRIGASLNIGVQFRFSGERKVNALDLYE